MTRKPKLSRKRSEYVNQRAAGVIVGKPLTYSAGQMERYQRLIGKLTSAMFKDYRRELASVFKANEVITIDASISAQARIVLRKLQQKWGRIFRRESPKIVDQIIGGIDKAAGDTLKQSLKQLSGGVTLKTDEMPAALKQAVSAAIAENVTLIKSIETQYHTQIEGAVMRSLQPGGRGLADVTEALQKYEGITDRRRNFIASDQTRKISTAISVERSKSAGIKKFKFLHSGGGSEPREDHVAMSGNIYSYDDPPVINKRTGKKGFPGTEPGCRCQMVPVIEWGDDD